MFKTGPVFYVVQQEIATSGRGIPFFQSIDITLIKHFRYKQSSNQTMILISILGKTWIPVMSDPEKPMPNPEYPDPDIVFRYTDQFELIHCFESNINGISRAFWRPQSFQAGFYLLGDVAIVAKEGSPPATEALLVSGYGVEDALKPPKEFGEVRKIGDVHIYKMGAPEGYTALGCVVVKGSTVPDPETCQYRCVKNEYLVEGALSFLWSLEEKTEHDMNNLQSIIRGEGDALGLFANTFAVTGGLLIPPVYLHYLLKDDGKRVKYAQNLKELPCVPPTPLNLLEVSELSMIWSGSDFSVWRAVSRDGFYPVGDMVVKGKKKPKKGYLVKPNVDCYNIAALQQPVSYSKIYGNGNWNSANDVQFWRPNPPAGYVALGDVATKNGEYPSLEDVYCVASDWAVAGSSENWVKIPTPHWTQNRGITLYEALAAPNNSDKQTVRGIGASPSVAPFFLSYFNYFPDGPIKKMYIYKVGYDHISNPSPKPIQLMQSVKLTNSGDAGQKVTRKFTCVTTELQSLEIDLQNIYDGIEVEIRSDMPKLGPDGKFIINVPSKQFTTVTFKTGEFKKKVSEEEVTAELNLPANSTMTVKISGDKYEASAHFTAMMKRIYYDGSENTVAITGRYSVEAVRGVDVSYLTPIIL